MTKTKNKNNIFQFIIALAAGCLVFAVMQGIHDNYGIMLPGIVARSGLDYASVSFVIAVGQILYGATQPVFGMLAIKKSNAFVMLLGIILMAIGLIVSPFCNSLWSLLLFFGILLPAGTGALCFGIVMGALAPIIGEKKAAVASGIVQASAGIGDAIMSPLLQQLTDSFGVTLSMPVFSIPILLMLPIVFWLGGKKKRIDKAQYVEATEETNDKKEKLSDILMSAFHDRTYWCLLIGFSTCGFHMSIIETHLFFSICGKRNPCEFCFTNFNSVWNFYNAWLRYHRLLRTKIPYEKCACRCLWYTHFNCPCIYFHSEICPICLCCNRYAGTDRRFHRSTYNRDYQQ